MKREITLILALIFSVNAFSQQWQRTIKNEIPKESSKTIHKASITPTANQIWWGYFTESDESTLSFLGTGAEDNFEAGIYIPSNHPVVGGSTVKAVRFWFDNSVSKISNMKIWINKSLTKNASGATYVQTVDVSKLSSGSNDIALTTPYSVNNEAFYIGYTIEMSVASYPVGCGGTDVENGFFIRATNTSSLSTWQDLSGEGYGNFAIQLLLDGVSIPDYSAKPSNMGLNIVKKGESAAIPINIYNGGQESITSLSYTITSNGNTSEEYNLNTSGISFNSSKDVIVSIPSDSECKKSTKIFTITKVNGHPNESSEKSSEGTLITIQEKPTVVPVVEEFTGTWCGYCPYGLVGMDEAHDTFGDKVALIAVHDSDPMYISAYDDIAEMNSSGFPNAMLNRKSSFYPYDFTDYISSCMQEATVGSITATANWTDDKKTSINISTNTEFQYSDDNGKYGIAYALVEDGMSGSDSSWNQRNYLNGSTSLPSDMSFWGNAGSNVSGYTFNHVAVGAWNILTGVKGSVNSKIATGEVQKYVFTADISSNSLIQDKSKLKVIAILISNETGYIINASVTEIKDASVGISSINNDAIITDIYAVDGSVRGALQKGINIVKYSNGRTEKIYVR